MSLLHKIAAKLQGEKPEPASERILEPETAPSIPDGDDEKVDFV